jgi:hypothetical protein
MNTCLPGRNRSGHSSKVCQLFSRQSDYQQEVDYRNVRNGPFRPLGVRKRAFTAFPQRMALRDSGNALKGPFLTLGALKGPFLASVLAGATGGAGVLNAPFRTLKVWNGAFKAWPHCWELP